MGIQPRYPQPHYRIDDAAMRYQPPCSRDERPRHRGRSWRRPVLAAAAGCLLAVGLGVIVAEAVGAETLPPRTTERQMELRQDMVDRLVRGWAR